MATAEKLLGARLKLERANKHICDFNSAVSAFHDSKPYTINTKADPNTGDLIHYVESLRAIPTEIPLIAADALFNLRSALDHTAMQLWIVGGRKGTERAVMFPVFDSATKYSSGKDGKIQGFRPDDIKAIDSVEPYKGGLGHQLWVLHELNNTDKHRLLLAVGAGFSHVSQRITPRGSIIAGVSVEFPEHWKCPLEIGHELVIRSPDSELKEDMNFVFEIAFAETQVAERDTALKTLQDMSKLVADVIDQLGRLL